MKKLLLLLFFIPVLIQAQFKVPVQKEQGYVQDYENVLTTQQIDTLNKQIYIINKNSSIELAVVILNDLQNYEIEDAALAIGRKWGVGQKNINNGIVYLISPASHKWRIEVGGGLEGDLPDITTEDIGSTAKEYFKNNDYYGGIEQVISRIEKQLDPVFKEQQKASDQEKQRVFKMRMREVINIVLFFLIIFGIFWAIMFSIKKKNEKNKRIEAEKEDAIEKKNQEAEKLKHEKIISMLSEINNYKTKISSLFNKYKEIEEKKSLFDKLNDKVFNANDLSTVISLSDGLRTLYNSLIHDLTYNFTSTDLYKQKFEENKNLYKNKVDALLAKANLYSQKYGFHKFINNSSDYLVLFCALTAFIADEEKTLSLQFPDSEQYKQRLKNEAAEAEKKRKQQEEEDEKRNYCRNDDDEVFETSNLSSDDDFSSSSDDDFGGFSGGSFSGGGASGSW